MTGRRRRAPSGRRATVIAVVLSLLLPGLGHAYMSRLGRALVWFGGVILIGLVVSRDGDNRALALAMGAAIAVAAAVDVALVERLDPPPRRGG